MRSCPKCRSSDYNNRDFQLMINICGHSLCQNCVNTIFALNSGPCPTCGKTLKKNGFWAQLLNDPFMERQVYYRKEYSSIFNLHEDNFPDLRQYNDYLEFVEGVIENLSTDTKVEETLKKVEDFEARWESTIAENKGRKTVDQLWVESELEEEKRYKERCLGYRALSLAEASEAIVKSKSAEAAAAEVITQLQTSAEPAAFIVNNAQRAARESRKRAAEEPSQEDKGHRAKEPRITFVDEWSKEVDLGVEEGYLFQYAPPPIILNGPAVHSTEELAALGFLRHIRPASKAQEAGGYMASFGCFRALLDASSDLFLL